MRKIDSVFRLEATDKIGLPFAYAKLGQHEYLVPVISGNGLCCLECHQIFLELSRVTVCHWSRPASKTARSEKPEKTFRIPTLTLVLTIL